MQLLHSVAKKSDKRRPALKPGVTVKVHQKIKEGNKERIQVFEGLVIAINPGVGADATFTVRKLVQGIGVEKVFLLHSPLITKLQVIKEGSVRRAKLYYMRERRGKSARLKEKFLTAAEMEVIEDEPVAPAEEAQADTDAPKTEVTDEKVVETAEAKDEKTVVEEEKAEVKEDKVEDAPKAEEAKDEPAAEKTEAPTKDTTAEEAKEEEK